MASLGLIGNCCGDCTICEAVGFLNPGDGRRFTPSGFGITENEGGTITLTLGRNPPCFSYHGTPDDYAAAHSGEYPPIGNEDYFYNTQGSGSFWQKLGGAFYTSGADPGWGVGAISLSLVIQQSLECSERMIEDVSQTIVWADGDVADKTVDVAITCPGPPQYWNMASGGLVFCGGELAYATLTLDDPDKYPCVQIGRPAVGEEAGNGVYLAGACTHDALCSGCGDPGPFDACNPVKHWSGSDVNTHGWHGFTDTTTRFLKAYFYRTEYTYDIFGPGGSCFILSTTITEGSLWMWGKAECVRETVDDGFDIDIDSLDPSGIVDNTHYEFYDSCGNLALTIELSEEEGVTPEPPTDAEANLTLALANSPDSGMAADFACDPPNEPAVAYTPITEDIITAQIVSYRYGDDWSEAVYKSTVDTRNNYARPYPYDIEMRTREYVYGGDEGTFGDWVDISNTVTTIEPPTTRGHGIYAEFRASELGFHCHPGA